MESISDNELLEELSKRFASNRRNIEELELLTDELRKVNKKLLDAESLKSNFVSNIANELINPFSSIIALSAEILALGNCDWDKVQKMVNLIHSEAFNLDFQLRNIFAAAKIEAGEITPESTQIDIKNFTKSVLDIYKIEKDKKDITIKESYQNLEKNTFKSDSSKLKLILSNILSNAIKFSGPSNSIELIVEQQDNQLTITCNDYGIGISEETQKIIFDRFSRASSGLSSIYRGHGLGLSVSKAYLDVLGGSISIESETDKSTSVVITIPELEAPATGFTSGNDEFIFDDDFTF